MKKNTKIYVAGHRGLVGSAIMRKLKKEGYNNLVYRTSSELDLRRQEKVEEFFKEEKPEYVILAAAKVGGIQANDTYSAEFLYDNLMIESNVIEAAYQNDVKKLLFLGSSCIYPKFADQPMKEDYLLSGKLESTNEGYAVAKITGIKLCEHYNKQYDTNFISAMPTNLYGPNDNFDLETSHVLPALIRKFHEAKINNEAEVVIWGTGKPRREFLHVDDLADALLFLMNNYKGDQFVNVGVGKDISILELAELIKDIVGFEGEIVNDLSKPDGTPRKLLDVTRLNDLGWEAQISLEEGIKDTYQWFKENY
ncbi:GDP-L-fucose synthase [Halanaerobium congolense]|jgi:GDP-L-fucose synthase|uniref:GDP-L-fucose synthase n=1 Tax=Halanaerobium congolense TaxID=54121 RepID=A0A1H9ZQN2_9FIRM|nr:GDP-L-fucose synthase [Halanaerobium congolense]PTX16346.1 GDP-L-fucose synthase [Halanaerobium congolense]SDF15520.1 GDP-L-fucose synthase [Halanaerobium congolense]SES84059.1 GDP-L-fucose synthase [Halanaerobium congolense]SFP44888.1 GDP-L-fucose synthase [Halanaerobium congolense]